MSQDEVFDVSNALMVKVGEATRQNVHVQGLWHQTFHCWIVHTSTTGESSLLLQVRHKDKDTYPNLLDISCAGHLQKGETVEDGVRKLQKELGVSVSFNNLIYCGMIAEEDMISRHLHRSRIQSCIYICL
jgi:isopentenyldiphosphate isomerase